MRFLLTLLFVPVVAFAQVDFPFDFETEATTPAFVDFEAAVTTVVPNPNPNDNNPSEYVAQMVRGEGGQVWAGSIVTLPDYLPLSTIGAFRMKVHAPMQGSLMRLKLEGNATAEIDAITTVAGDWEELEWDFTGLPDGVFNQVAFMLDFGLYGDGSALSTNYFDDIELFDGAGDLIQVDLPIMHEDPSVHYQTTSFAGNIADLATDPTDASNTVTKATKHWTGLTYAGTTMSTPLGLTSPIAFEPGFTSISVDVYSPTAGLPVRLKAEQYLDMAQSVETQINTTTAYEWETLTFDFTQNVPGTPNINYNTAYTILSIFFDFGNEGFMSGTTDYFYDNVTFNGNPSSVGMAATETALLYPTILPAGQPVFVQCSAPVGFTLTNLSGQVVMNQVITGSGALELPRLAPGVYVYRLGDQTAKLVIKPE